MIVSVATRGRVVPGLAFVGALALSLALSACTGSSPVTVAPSPGASSGGSGGAGGGGNGGGSGGNGGGGGSPPGDGASIYLNIVPPGSNGNSAGGLGVQNKLPLTYPPNFKDQATLYGDLTYAKSPLQAAPCNAPTSIAQHTAASNLACDYFKHEGLTPDTLATSNPPYGPVPIETITAPSGDTVTIKRDQWGVPFISAKTREDAMYGVGYANAEDRLWLDDLLRRVGRGEITAFLGAAPGISSFDANLAVTAGYSDQELTNMVDAAVAQLGPAGQLFLEDAQNFVKGINAYIQTLTPVTGKNAFKIPPEYASLRLPDVPVAPIAIQPFTVDDIVASAILIQSLFATGGGGEATNELLLQKLDPGFTAGATSIPVNACELWRDLRNADDPDSPVTIDSTAAHQSPATLPENCPQAVAPATAIWDVGSFTPRSPLQVGNLSVPSLLQGLPGLLQSLLPGLSSLFPGAGVPGSGARNDVTTPFAPSTAVARSLPAGAAPAFHVASLADDAPLVKAAAKPRWIAASVNPLLGAKQALRRAGIAVPNTTSNWIAVNADQTVDGHPIAVMGPQTSYFAPELLWEFGVHSDEGTPGNPQLAVDGRGIATAMLPYIEIGRGADYAWSATSGEGDLVDTFVSKMCNTDGSAPSLTLGSNGFPQADGYMYGGQCRKFYERVDSWTAPPTVAAIALGGSPLPQTVHRYIMRTHYGPVIATATVGGQPVAISQERSTFYNEISTAIPFALADTKLITGPKAFQDIFNGVTGTFNWLYVDSRHVAYLQSGLLPIRSPADTQPDLPVWGDGSYDWVADSAYLGSHPDYFKTHGGFDSATRPTGPDPGASLAYPPRLVVEPQGNLLQTGTVTFLNYLPMADHPQAIDPPRGYIDSWNNRPSHGWWAPDSNGSWGPTHRVAMLGKRLAAFQASGRKFDFANMVNIMSDAAYTDLRGQAVLPLLLQVMQSQPAGAPPLTADQQKVVTLMQNWLDGAPDGKPNPSDSSSWIGGPDDADLGAFRRDTNPADAGKATKDRVYDQQAAVVLMDAWYPQLAKTVLPQVEAIDSCNPATGGNGAAAAASNDEGTATAADFGLSLQGCYDAPRAQGSAYQSGWFELMVRVLRMALGTANAPYRALKCGGADGGSLASCRAAVLTALDSALDTLGGVANEANWDGTQLPSAQYGSTTGHTVEDYDSIIFTDFSLLGVPNMPWENRPTFQQVVEVRN